jgi:hypothetical protein
MTDNLTPTEKDAVLARLRELYTYVIGPARPTAADTCEVLYGLFESLGWPVP